MEELDEVRIWVGGHFVRDPELRYEGGKMYVHPDIDLDLMNDDLLYQWYTEAGGKRSQVSFHYVIPGQSMENGLRSCNGDIGSIDLTSHYKGLEVCTIYAEETDCEPLVAVDTQGNLLFSQSTERGDHIQENVHQNGEQDNVEGQKGDPMEKEEIPALLYLPGLDHTCIGTSTERDEPAVNLGENDGVEKDYENARDDIPEGATEARCDIEEHATVEPGNATEQMVFEARDETEEHATVFTEDASDERDDIEKNAEKESENIHEESERDLQARGKRKILANTEEEDGSRDYEDASDTSDDGIASFTDDSQDNDYMPCEEEDELSEAPSDAYEDVEGSEDDDIFIEKNLSKRDIRKKLRDMRGKKKGGARHKKKRVAGDDWFSDVESEDEISALSDSENRRQKFPLFRGNEHMKSFELTVGLRFPNAQKYREVLRDWCVRKRYEIVFVNNDNKRITVKCKHGCDWRLHASPIQGTSVFQVKTLKGQHTCARRNDNDLATYKYLALRIEKQIRDDPDIGLQKVKEIIRRKCGVEVNTFKAMRAKKEALSKIRGNDSKEYELLWDYCETVRERNPGSKLLLRKHPDMNPPTFDRMYFSLDAMKKAFLSGCRPIIGVDGCFLKTVYGGQLLVAVGRDGNDNLLPIAMAVVQVENKDTWMWFLGELLQDIGDGNWTIISDRQKGLVDAVGNLLPNSEHRFCLRHLYQNFKMKYRAPALKDLFWKAACTANKNEHEHWMNKIEEADQKVAADYETAAEWLRQIPSQHWCRAYFSTYCKSDILVNNICESFNNYILDAREKPIISMFEWIRERLMSRVQVKRQGMEKYNRTVCPNILKRLDKCYEQSRHCYPRWCGEEEFEVGHTTGKYVVDLFKRTCGCGMFQLSGYPCPHAYASILHIRGKIEDYVDPLYKKDMYLRVYAHMIHGVGGNLTT